MNEQGVERIEVSGQLKDDQPRSNILVESGSLTNDGVDMVGKALQFVPSNSSDYIDPDALPMYQFFYATDD